MFRNPHDALRHHVTGAVERGEAVAIVNKQACEWFLMCRNEAIGAHYVGPLMRLVPVCQRCADRVGLEASEIEALPE